MNKNIKNLTKLISGLLLCTFVSSCGSNYEKQCKTLECSLKENKKYSFPSLKENSINYLLVNQEAGLYYFLKNDLDCSLNHFNNALLAYNKIKENKASGVTKNLTAVTASPTFTKYEGSDFEESLVHYYKGLTYLSQNDLNKSLIEFRAAEDILKFSQESRQKKINAQESKINKLMSESKLSSQELDKFLKLSTDARANNQSKFLNGNILYISGIVKEINKQYNDALVNYKQAYNIQPNNLFLRKDLYRLSLQYDIEYAQHLEKIDPKLSTLKHEFQNLNNKNSVYIIYEQGFIPKRENYKISVVGLDNLILSINLPVYNTKINTNNSNNVSISIPGNGIEVPAEEIASIYKLANNQLIESYTTIVANQLAKLVLQVASQKALQSNSKTKYFSMVFGATSLLDSADLRSWYTLPSSVQIARIDIDKNKNINKIVLNVNNSSYTLDLPLKNNIGLYYIFDTGSKLYTKILY